jgi:hypothetical protein
VCHGGHGHAAFQLPLKAVGAVVSGSDVSLYLKRGSRVSQLAVIARRARTPRATGFLPQADANCYHDLLVPRNDGVTVLAPGPTDYAAPQNGMYFTWRSGLAIWVGPQNRWVYRDGVNSDGSNWWPWKFVDQFEQWFGYPAGYGQQGYAIGRGFDQTVYAWEQKAYYINGRYYVGDINYLHVFDEWNTAIVNNGTACLFP